MHPTRLPVRVGGPAERFSHPGCLLLQRHVTLPKPTDPASPIPPSSSPRPHERALIARVLAGDRSAARALYNAHVDRVYRLAYRLTGDENQARELTQDAFIRAFGQLHKFRGASAFGTWLYRVTVSVASNARRKRRRHEHRETDLSTVAALADDAPARAEPDLRERMAAAIDDLPEIYRTTFVMHDVEGYTHPEIADVLGVAEGTCKSRLFIARGMLRKALAPFRKE